MFKETKKSLNSWRDARKNFRKLKSKKPLLFFRTRK